MVDAKRPPRPGTKAARLLAVAAEDEHLVKLTPERRARALVERFGVFDKPISSEEAQERLVAMGEAAVPVLIEALEHPSEGWQAAMTLAEIGMPDARTAIPALIEHARRAPESSAVRWAAVALARFGLLDEVAALIDVPDKVEYAVGALADMAPRSYPWFERALGRHDAGITRAVANALTPGRGWSRDPAPEAFDHGLAGVSSPHAVIRADAVWHLTHKAYPRATLARAVPVLVQLIADPSSEVRRLAVLTLGRVGKRWAGPATAALERATKDKHKKVREMATYSLNKLKKK